MGVQTNNDSFNFTFIGTGVTNRTPNGTEMKIAQNLPYGTHIVHLVYPGGGVGGKYFLDGVEIQNSTSGSDWWTLEWLTFYQPKRPPIPEDAVVLADYMLMADFVKQTATGADIQNQISKGVRWQSASSCLLYTSPSPRDRQK